MSELALALPKPTAAHRRVASRLAVALEHPAALYVASLAVGSRASMIDALKRAARFFGGEPHEVEWHRLAFGHMVALRSHLCETAAPATANKILSAVRGVLRFSVKLELMTQESFARAVDIPIVKGSREPKGRSLSQDELRRMFLARVGPDGARDRAILALLCGGGLRRAELASLTVASLEGDNLRVRGKGNKERIVPLPAGAMMALGQWFDVRGKKPGALFYALAADRRLSYHGYYCALDRMAHDAGVVHFSPHDLRRTYIGDLLDAGVDLATVQALVGHADPATTARYDRRGPRARREAVDRLPMPL